jgi:quercetin dioxygenase-like cupin family protein
MAMKGKPQQQLETKTMKTRHVTNPTHRSPFWRALLVITPALVIIAVFTAVPARATPACGVTTVDLLFNQNPAQPAFFPNGSLDLLCNELQQYGWGLKTKVKGDSDLYIVQNTFPPGADTGWHTHPGPSLVTIISGALTVYEADSCNTPIVYQAGQSFTDLGCGDVHTVRNEGSVCAVNIAVQIVPHGQPRRIDEAQPANCPTFICPSPTPGPCP